MNESGCTRNKEKSHLRQARALVLGTGVMDKDEMLDSTYICFCNIPTSFSKGGGEEGKGSERR